MRLLLFCATLLMLACNTTTSNKTTTSEEKKSSVTLPYTAAFSSNWSTDISDEDLKTVLLTTKYWQDGNIKALVNLYDDTLTFDSWEGKNYTLTREDVETLWKPLRDSISKVEIRMEAWQKMYSIDKKEAIIATWYAETDTYKNGKVESFIYHEFNRIENGKIVSLSQFRRPFGK
jgi:hypothetical protein